MSDTLCGSIPQLAVSEYAPSDPPSANPSLSLSLAVAHDEEEHEEDTSLLGPSRPGTRPASPASRSKAGTRAYYDPDALEQEQTTRELAAFLSVGQVKNAQELWSGSTPPADLADFNIMVDLKRYEEEEQATEAEDWSETLANWKSAELNSVDDESAERYGLIRCRTRAENKFDKLVKELNGLGTPYQRPDTPAPSTDYREEFKILATEVARGRRILASSVDEGSEPPSRGRAFISGTARRERSRSRQRSQTRMNMQSMMQDYFVKINQLYTKLEAEVASLQAGAVSSS